MGSNNNPEKPNESIINLKNHVCAIEINNKIKGNGFLVNLEVPQKLVKFPVLITLGNILSKDEIKKNKKIKLHLKNSKSLLEIIIDKLRKLYTNEENNFTLIEIKKEDGLNINSFLEIDYQFDFKYLMKNNKNINKIYSLSHLKGENNLIITKGQIYSINQKKNSFEYTMNSTPVLGSPLLIKKEEKKNNKIDYVYKVVGIFDSFNGKKGLCNGILIKEPIKFFFENNKKKEEINIGANNKIIKTLEEEGEKEIDYNNIKKKLEEDDEDFNDLLEEDNEEDDNKEIEENDLQKSFINVDIINKNEKIKFNLDIIWIDGKVFNSENQNYFEKMKHQYPNIKIQLFDNLENGFNKILDLEYISIFVIVSGRLYSQYYNK